MKLFFQTVLASLTLLSGFHQVSFAADPKVDPKVQQIMQNSFVAAGVADLGRLTQDPIQLLCSDASFQNTKTDMHMFVIHNFK